MPDDHDDARANRVEERPEDWLSAGEMALLAQEAAEEDARDAEGHAQMELARLREGISDLLRDLAKADAHHFSIGLMGVRLRALLGGV